ncbi:MDR family MFS transporter [Bifidobacterium bohemicum]|uniref:Lincomycin resistance protein LmrB n=1 Tax=Bifidobacterium bohemicum DSM 22767 TaxID=1437606 RepID=A0A086ZH02_9BIFI|nr:MDR family MFS transporter [Bifidobacterium bohemicum]KFI45802.1 lincomycin resistance protein LmrB [Bifidobacterium bohemicum DSM 22767]
MPVNKAKVPLSKVLTRKEAYHDGHLSHEAFVSIAILTFITFIGNFTQLQLSAALPTIVSEFGINVTTGQWLTSVIQLVQGVMVPLTAYLTRRFSTRRIVTTSMTIFTLGSLLAWQGSTFGLVLAGRTLEAIGSGVMWPVLQIIVFSVYPMSKRGVAMGTVGVAMSVAPAIGPTFGGWQTDANGWRSIFLSLTIVGAIALTLAVCFMHNFNQNDKDAKADFFSVFLSVFGFGGLLFGFTNIETYAFTNPLVWLPMTIGIVGIVWFVMRQIRGQKRYQNELHKLFVGLETDIHQAADTCSEQTVAELRQELKQLKENPESADKIKGLLRNPATHDLIGKIRELQPPLLDLTVLKNRSFRVGTIIAAMSFFAFSSITVIIPLFIQNDRGYSATISGLVMLPGALGQCISQFGGGRMLDRYGARPVALTGASILFIGTVMMSFINPSIPIWWVSICQFIRQIGMGFVLMPITTWSLNCLPVRSVSAGSAVTNTMRQISGAIGAPVLVILMEEFAKVKQNSLGAGSQAAKLASIYGIKASLIISSCIALGMLLIVLFGVRGQGAGSARDLAERTLRHIPVPHLHAHSATK